MSSEPVSEDRPVQVLDFAQLLGALRNERVEVQVLPQEYHLGLVTIFGPAAPLYIRWVPQEPMVMVSQVLPVSIPVSRLDALGRSLIRLNFSLGIGGFVADLDSGQVYLRTHLFVSQGGTVDYLMLLNVIVTCVSMAHRSLPTLRSVASAQPMDADSSPIATTLAAESVKTSLLLSVLQGFVD